MSRSICILFGFIAVSAFIFFAAASGTSASAKGPAGVPKVLLEKRLDTVRDVFRLNLQRLQSGEAIPDEGCLVWSEHWLNAELALSDKRANRIAALKAHLERTKELEQEVGTYTDAGQGRESLVQAAAYYRIDAEIRLLQTADE